MKSLARRATPAAVFFALASVASAHPGHDGDHDFTWDFSHLVEHPIATVLCLAVLGAAVAGGWVLVRERAAKTQSLRTSQRNAGK